MSSSGPAPWAKRKPGFGCHRSGPWVWNAVCANIGSPMTPAAMARRALWKPGPSSVSGAAPIRTPAAFACSSSAAAPSRSRPSGFSDQTCLPAAIAADVTSMWASGVVRLTTSSHAGVGQDVRAAAVRGDAVLLGLGAGPVGDEVADDQHLDVRERVQVLQVGVADDPDPDDADADGAHRT